MNDLFEYILAAGRKKPNDLSWLVPLILVVVYGLSGIARVFKKSSEDQPKPQKRQPAREDRLASQRWQEQADRKQQLREQKLQRQETRSQHHIITQDSQPQEEVVVFEPETPTRESSGSAERQRILQEMMGQVFGQTQAKAPKPIRKPIKRKSAPKEPVVMQSKGKPARSEQKTQVLPTAKTHGLGRLEGLNELKKAILYAEILGKPKSMQNN